MPAARFARRFYENWVRGGFASDALAMAKSSFIFNQHEFSAIAYEFWDTPETLKLYPPDEAEVRQGAQAA